MEKLAAICLTKRAKNSVKKTSSKQFLLDIWTLWNGRSYSRNWCNIDSKNTIEPFRF